VFWLVVGLVQPLLYMFLYGPMLTKLLATAQGQTVGDSWRIFLPALLLQTTLTQSTFVGLGLLTEYRAGVFERFRVAPISRTALLLGKLANTGVTVAILSTLIALLCRAAFRMSVSLGGLALAVLLNIVLSVALASYSYALALRTKNEQGLGTLLNVALLPLLLLSGAFLPITTQTAPTWLYVLSRLNPIAYVLDATRAGLRGEWISGETFIGMGMLAVITALGFGLAVRAFSREDA
jgi:ABC-2 type transport system permease protein